MKKICSLRVAAHLVRGRGAIFLANRDDETQQATVDSMFGTIDLISCTVIWL